MNNEVETIKRLGKLVFTMETESLPVDNDKEKMKFLKLISTPYREGTHWTKYPTSFIPIIEQLETLHSNYYVHGDIRVYNIIFYNQIKDDGTVEKKGWLIDFDFGGICIGASPVTYPPGYVQALPDGRRIGIPEKVIRKWHDWYALGQLIFSIHTLIQPKNVQSGLTDRMYNMMVKWTEPKNPYDDDVLIQYEIDELKTFLIEYEDYQFTLRASILDITVPHDIRKSCKEATSSPIQKKL
jgi:hypothetical protein